MKFSRRIKNGKARRYWSIVESKRCAGGRVVQRQVLYLGELNDSQQEAWCGVIEAFDEDKQSRWQLRYLSWSSNILASFKSSVSKPSVNQP
jgi:hypothetical protein